MKDTWKLLGIEPTDDLVSIKRAYAARLKFHHPEEDPEGFQQLREAYEIALKTAKSGQLPGYSAAASTLQDAERHLDSEEELEAGGEGTFGYRQTGHSPDQRFDGVYRFLQQTAEIYDHFPSRMDMNRWRTLLENEDYSGIETRQILRIETLRLFMDRVWLPGPVWRLLNEVFEWTFMEIDLQHLFPKEFLDYLGMQLAGCWDLGYDPIHFAEMPPDDLERFLSARYSAQNALIQGNLERAGECLHIASELLPEDPDLNRLIGEYCLRLNHYEGALLAWKRLEASGERDLNFRLELAHSLLRIGYVEDAYSVYNEILVHTPEQVQALSGAARCHVSMGRMQDAIQLYGILHERCPWDLHARIQLITLTNKFEANLKSKMEDPDPKVKSMALRQLAELYLDQELREDAVQLFLQLEELDPLTPGENQLLATYFYEQEQYEKAAHRYETAVSIEDHGLFHKELGKTYVMLDRFEEAVFHFKQAQLHDEIGHDYYYLYGFALFKLGKYSESIQNYNKAIELDRDPNFLYNRAFAHYYLGDFERCCQDIQEYLDGDDDDLRMYAYLIQGNSQFLLKQWDAAASAYAHSLEHRNDAFDQSILWKLYAASLIAGRRFREALDPLRQVQQLKTNNEWAMLHVVRIYAELQQWDALSEELIQYMETFKQDERNPYIWFYSGILAYYVDNAKGAEKCFRIAYDSGLRGDTCSYYSLVLQRLGEHQDAMVLAREALDDRPEHPDYKERLKLVEEQIQNRKNIFKRIGMQLVADKKAEPKHLDYPDILGDPQLQAEFPGVVIKK